jgi:uncharacterized phage-associated protein
MMKPTYREDKATQAAALFLTLRGGKMSHLKLMKLLYIAEREALLRWGRPITFDACVSMDQGPVLSQTLNRMNGSYRPDNCWDKAISTPSDNEVQILEDPGVDKLSDAEEQLIREVFTEHGRKSRWDLVEWTHGHLGEWRDPKGSSIEIDYRDILRTVEKTDVEVKDIFEDLESLALAERYFGE